MKKKQMKVRSFDYSLLFVIIFLVGFGLVMIYSTSSYVAQQKFNNAEYYFKKQLLAVGLGFVAMYIAYRLDYHFLKKIAPLLYIVSLITILLVPFIGYSANGAKRWIEVGPLSFQPAELTKIAVILYTAGLISKWGPAMEKKKLASLFKLAFVGGIPSVMILFLTDNLSSAVIILGICCVLVFLAYPGYKLFAFLGVVASAALVFAYSWLKANADTIQFSGFRGGRILTWLNPEKYADSTGLQTLQALYAIGSGGVFGKGLGKSLQKLSKIPEVQNDMIFSVICEELGLFGATCLILLFVLMLWRFLYIANHSKDIFGNLLVMGVFAHIAIQVMFNIGVVTNVLPNTGISLPFISYGGTSVMFLMAEMGIVLNVSTQIDTGR